MKRKFSTAAVRAVDRLAYWREAVCETYILLGCETSAPTAFSGEIELSRHDKISTSFVGGSDQVVRRRARDLSRDVEASFILSLQLEKESLVEQGDRLAHLKPGDFAMYSSLRQYRLRLPGGFRQLVVQIPRDILLAHFPSADDFVALTASSETTLGRITAETLPKLVAALEEADGHASISCQNTIIDLLVSALAPMNASAFELNSSDRLALLRARSMIDESVSDPDLSREGVAAAVGLSVRRLNELFQKEDSSITNAIRSARFNRIAGDLTDPKLRNVSISEIALSRGVTNLQNFSKAFRERFGCSPSEYRAGVLVGRP